MIRRPSELAWARRTLWRALGTRLGKGTRTVAPTAQPVSLHREELPQLLEGGYRVSLKADGVRYLLLLTTRESDNEHMALMFDRALTPYEVSVWGPAELFERESLFDGELIRERGANGANAPTGYLAFDVMLLAGERVATRSYDHRLEILGKALDVQDPKTLTDERAEALVVDQGKVVAMHNDRPLWFGVKPAMELSQARQLWEQRHCAGFSQDGLIFMPVSAPVCFGKHTGMFKWKSQHTIDVLAKSTGKRDRDGNRMWQLHALRGRKLVCVSEEEAIRVMPPGEQPYSVSCQLIDTLAMGLFSQHAGGVVVECSIDLDAEPRLIRLHPLRHRPDKLSPNAVSTIESTIGNVVDHVQLEDLLKFLERC